MVDFGRFRSSLAKRQQPSNISKYTSFHFVPNGRHLKATDLTLNSIAKAKSTSHNVSLSLWHQSHQHPHTLTLFAEIEVASNTALPFAVSSSILVSTDPEIRKLEKDAPVLEARSGRKEPSVSLPRRVRIPHIHVISRHWSRIWRCSGSMKWKCLPQLDCSHLDSVVMRTLPAVEAVS